MATRIGSSQHQGSDQTTPILLILESKDLCSVVVLDGVGAEMFAYHAWKFADELIKEMSNGRCWCESVECAEHGANSAIYSR